MFYDFIGGQSFVIELFLLLYIIPQCHHDVCCTSIYNGVVLKHPFFLANVVSAYLACVFEHTFKQVSVDIQKFQRCKRERLFAQQFCNIGCNSVSFFLFFIVLVMCGLVDVIRFQPLPNIINGDIAFNMAYSSLS